MTEAKFVAEWILQKAYNDTLNERMQMTEIMIYHQDRVSESNSSIAMRVACLCVFGASTQSRVSWKKNKFTNYNSQ